MNFNPDQIQNYTQNLILSGRSCKLIEFIHDQTKEKIQIIYGKINQNVHFNTELYNQIRKNECFNIIQIIDKIQKDDEMFIQLEPCDFSLNQYMLNRKSYSFSNEEIYDILSQIINAYVNIGKYTNHSMELNPSNILVKKLKNQKILIKIFINFFQNDQKQAQNFTHYKAPEELSIGYNNPSLKTDIYLLGIALHQLCYKMKRPTEGINNIPDLIKFQQDLRQKKFSEQLKSQDDVDQNLKSLIGRMLEYYEHDRITWEQLSNNAHLQLNFYLLQNKYYINLTQSLGRGSQGVTYFVENLETNQSLCAKKIDTTQIEGQREEEIYRKLMQQKHKNKNVIQIFDIVQTQDDHQTFLIMEKCDSNIEEYYLKKNKKLEDEEIMDLIKQIVNGYCYLKNINIIHRDLKPQNILVKYENQNPIFKIIDFGVGKIIAKTEIAITVAGTPIFTAPEVIEGKQYDYKCDIFSLGTIIYYLIYGKYYLNVQSLDELFRKQQELKNKPLKCPKPNRNSSLINKFIQLIENMTLYEPDQRISWEKLNEQLNQNNEDNQQPFRQQIDNFKINDDQKIQNENQYEKNNNFQQNQNQYNGQYEKMQNNVGDQQQQNKYLTNVERFLEPKNSKLSQRQIISFCQLIYLVYKSKLTKKQFLIESKQIEQ